VLRRDNDSSGIRGMLGKINKIRNFYHLSVEKENRSRHLVFWSLRTLIGLRDRARGLVA